MRRDDELLDHAREVLRLEMGALARLAERLDGRFAEVCRDIDRCAGRVVVVGMGKSGHVGNKIASTLASTGTPAFFVHPGEASHGDLGMITQSDLVIAISNSGETPEVVTLLPIIKRMGVKLVALTGRPDSTLGRAADHRLDVGVEREACPLNLAPTASTTATLAMGDAIAVSLLRMRGFTERDFARSHPGGRLGRRLLVYVEDIMHRDSSVPLVSEDDSVTDALVEMTSKGLGMTGVVGAEGRLTGIFTDGDLRRALNRSVDVYGCRIADVMTRNPYTLAPGDLAVELVKAMEKHSINGVFVVDHGGRVLGALNAHDLFRAGVI